MLRAALIALIFLVSSNAFPAFARGWDVDANICNRGAVSVRVAVHEGYPLASRVRGWYDVEPGDCEFFPSPSTLAGLTFAFVQIDKDGTVRNPIFPFDSLYAGLVGWSPKAFCAPLDRAFRDTGDPGDYTNGDCPAGYVSLTPSFSLMGEANRNIRLTLDITPSSDRLGRKVGVTTPPSRRTAPKPPPSPRPEPLPPPVKAPPPPQPCGVPLPTATTADRRDYLFKLCPGSASPTILYDLSSSQTIVVKIDGYAPAGRMSSYAVVAGPKFQLGLPAGARILVCNYQSRVNVYDDVRVFWLTAATPLSESDRARAPKVEGPAAGCPTSSRAPAPTGPPQ